MTTLNNTCTLAVVTEIPTIVQLCSIFVLKMLLPFPFNTNSTLNFGIEINRYIQFFHGRSLCGMILKRGLERDDYIMG